MDTSTTTVTAPASSRGRAPEGIGARPELRLRGLPDNPSNAGSRTAPACEGDQAQVLEAIGTVKLPAWARLGAWLNRSRRVLFTLGAVWIISTFDLGFTIAQWGTTEFLEANPIAAPLLNGPTHVLIIFKFGLLSFTTLVLMLLRRHLVAELACWFLLATKLYVAIRWFVYLDCVVRGVSNPLVEM